MLNSFQYDFLNSKFLKQILILKFSSFFHHLPVPSLSPVSFTFPFLHLRYPSSFFLLSSLSQYSRPFICFLLFHSLPYRCQLSLIVTTFLTQYPNFLPFIFPFPSSPFLLFPTFATYLTLSHLPYLTPFTIFPFVSLTKFSTHHHFPCLTLSVHHCNHLYYCLQQ